MTDRVLFTAAARASYDANVLQHDMRGYGAGSPITSNTKLECRTQYGQAEIVLEPAM